MKLEKRSISAPWRLATPKQEEARSCCSRNTPGPKSAPPTFFPKAILATTLAKAAMQSQVSQLSCLRLYLFCVLLFLSLHPFSFSLFLSLFFCLFSLQPKRKSQGKEARDPDSILFTLQTETKTKEERGPFPTISFAILPFFLLVFGSETQGTATSLPHDFHLSISLVLSCSSGKKKGGLQCFSPPCSLVSLPFLLFCCLHSSPQV